MKRALVIGLPVLLVVAVLAAWQVPRHQRMRSVHSAEARWSAGRITSYTWTQTAGGFMVGPQRVKIVVRDARAMSAMVAGEPQRLGELTGHPQTVDELFSWIEAAVGSDRFDATYDTRCGYPTSFAIDRSRNTTDDEYGLGVLDLQPIEPA